MQRPTRSLLSALSLALIHLATGASAEPVSRPSVTVLPMAGDSAETRLAVHWRGDPTARLSAWTVEGEILFLDRALLDEELMLFTVSEPGSGPLRFRLDREGHPPKTWKEGSKATGDTQRDPTIPPCTWRDDFHSNGPDNVVTAAVVYDDGSGAALYVGGFFKAVGDDLEASYLAKWDGTSWSPIPGVYYGVSALTVYDDGNGPKLIVGSPYITVDDSITFYIAAWDGTSWSSLGRGLNDFVYDLAVYDDGNGSKLVAGGNFTAAVGGATLSYIGLWNGSQWSPLESGLDDQVDALAVYDEGEGPVLMAGGLFTKATNADGEVSVDHVARWDGSTWSSLGSGTDAWVRALTVYDDGEGSELIVAGRFSYAGGAPARRIARWDGNTWAPLGTGLDPQPRALQVFDDGSGPKLIVGGGPDPFIIGNDSFTAGQPEDFIAQWDGMGWSSLGTGIDRYRVESLTTYDLGSGPRLAVGGDFSGAGGTEASFLARWDGTDWSAFHGEPAGFGADGYVLDFTTHDDGRGAALYAGGDFGVAGRTPANRIARWDGTRWEALGSGFTGPNGEIKALASYDDGRGDGPILVAGGYLRSAEDGASRSVAAWDGSDWTDLGEDIFGGSIEVLTVYNDGSDPVLVAAGQNNDSGSGDGSNRIFAWDGVSWSILGNGGFDGPIFALTTYDDGSGDGPILVAGGFFSELDGIPMSNLAQWDGTSWTSFGTGSDGVVRSLVSYHDGEGEVLAAGGAFETVDGVAALHVARWNGTQWQPYGNGIQSSVRRLTSYPYKGRPLLVATSSRGQLVQWNGAGWPRIGARLDHDIWALTTFDDGSGPSLVAGGRFESVELDHPSARIAMCTRIEDFFSDDFESGDLDAWMPAHQTLGF